MYAPMSGVGGVVYDKVGEDLSTWLQMEAYIDNSMHDNPMGHSRCTHVHVYDFS